MYLMSNNRLLPIWPSFSVGLYEFVSLLYLRQRRHYVFLSYVLPAVRPLSIVRPITRRVTRYLFALWRNFNETRHKYSSCEWELQ